MTAMIRAENLTRTYSSAAGDVHALIDATLEVEPGELVIVRGPSGAGKSTLLNLLGTLDTPTAGTVWIDGRDVTTLGEDALADLRRDNLGFIFQSFGLVSILSAAENVELPLRIAKVDPAERDARVAEALERVALTPHAQQRPSELSGGQQQRVGIARAIVSRPRVLIADEPTGQLDSRTAMSIMELLSELTHSEGIAAIVSTHDPVLVARADRVIDIHDGRIVANTRVEGSEVGVPEAEAPDTASAEVPEAEVPTPAPAEVPEPAQPLTRAQLRQLREQTGEVQIITYSDE